MEMPMSVEFVMSKAVSYAVMIAQQHFIQTVLDINLKNSVLEANGSAISVKFQSMVFNSLREWLLVKKQFALSF